MALCKREENGCGNYASLDSYCDKTNWKLKTTRIEIFGRERNEGLLWLWLFVGMRKKKRLGQGVGMKNRIADDAEEKNKSSVTFSERNIIRGPHTRSPPMSYVCQL